MKVLLSLALTLILWSHGSSPARLGSSKRNQQRTDRSSIYVEALGGFDASVQQHCPEHCQETKLNLHHSQEQLQGARVFYLILVHNERTVEGALHLFRAIRDPRNILLIHVDAKAKGSLINNSTFGLWQEIQDCPCGSQVRVESVHSVEWGAWSMNDPTFYGMETAVNEYSGQWDVFINLAGDTLPVYTPNSMSLILSDISKYNFVTSSSCETGLLPTNVYQFPEWWHKRNHYTQGDTEDDLVLNYTLSNGTLITNRVIITHFGSQWAILQSQFVHWFVSEFKTTKRKDSSLPALLAHHLQQSGKLMTDETFMATLLMHAEEFRDSLPVVDPETNRLLWNNGTVSHIGAVRFERMDEHYPTAFGAFWQHQRYDVLENSGVDVPRPWGPYYLGVYDLGAIKTSGALFVRKVSAEIDDNLYRLLPVDYASQIPDISWPKAELKLTAKPDWQSWYAELKQETPEAGEEEEEDDDDDEEHRETEGFPREEEEEL